MDTYYPVVGFGHSYFKAVKSMGETMPHIELLVKLLPLELFILEVFLNHKLCLPTPRF
jgi:hypothetical protein